MSALMRKNTARNSGSHHVSLHKPVNKGLARAGRLFHTAGAAIEIIGESSTSPTAAARHGPACRTQVPCHNARIPRGDIKSWSTRILIDAAKTRERSTRGSALSLIQAEIRHEGGVHGRYRVSVDDVPGPRIEEPRDGQHAKEAAPGTAKH